MVTPVFQVFEVQWPSCLYAAPSLKGKRKKKSVPMADSEFQEMPAVTPEEEHQDNTEKLEQVVSMENRATVTFNCNKPNGKSKKKLISLTEFTCEIKTSGGFISFRCSVLYEVSHCG